MIPHPVTMRFAWDEDVQRCARVLVSVFLLAVIVLIGAPVLMSPVQNSTPAVADESSQEPPAFAALSSSNPELLDAFNR